MQFNQLDISPNSTIDQDLGQPAQNHGNVMETVFGREAGKPNPETGRKGWIVSDNTEMSGYQIPLSRETIDAINADYYKGTSRVPEKAQAGERNTLEEAQTEFLLDVEGNPIKQIKGPSANSASNRSESTEAIVKSVVSDGVGVSLGRPEAIAYLHVPGVKIPYKYNEIQIIDDKLIFLILAKNYSDAPEFEETSEGEHIIMSFKEKKGHKYYCSSFGISTVILDKINITVLMIDYVEQV